MTVPGQPPPRDPQHTSRAFYASCAFGAVGLVVVAVGMASGSNGVSLAGYALGALSLVAALAWRSELIVAWRARKALAPSQPGQARSGPSGARPGSSGPANPRSS